MRRPPWDVLLILFAITALLFVGGALAQTTDPPPDAGDALDQFWRAITDHKWGLAAVIATMLLVAFVRFIAPRIHGKFGVWINQTRVSAGLAFASGLLSALAAQLLKGKTLSLDLLVYGFGIGVAAIGGYNAFWDLLFPNDKTKTTSIAESAGVLAKTLSQPPPPPPAAPEKK